MWNHKETLAPAPSKVELQQENFTSKFNEQKSPQAPSNAVAKDRPSTNSIDFNEKQQQRTSVAPAPSARNSKQPYSTVSWNEKQLASSNAIDKQKGATDNQEKAILKTSVRYSEDRYKEHFVQFSTSQTSYISTSFSDETYLESLSSSIFEEEQYNELDDDSTFDSISLASTISSEATILRYSQVEQGNFFSMLQNIPNVRDVSEDSSSKSSDTTISTLQTNEMLDVGVFVDALTGLQPESSTDISLNLDRHSSEENSNVSRTTTEWEVFNEIKAQECLDELRGPILESSDDEEVFGEFQSSSEDASLKSLQKKTSIDEAVAIFKEACANQSKEIIAINIKAINEREMERENIQTFLDDLIQRTVNRCETVDPKKILCESLDKMKMMFELKAKLLQFNVERKVSSFLNRRMVEHYRRKQKYFTFKQLKPETAVIAKEKYKEAILRFVKLLDVKEKMKNSLIATIDDLKLKKLTEQEKVDEDIVMLKELINETLLTNTAKTENLKTMIPIQLDKMADLRKEITQIRSVLLKALHINAKLKEKSKKADILQDNVTMQDFENLQVQITTMGKKIEDKNAKLYRLRARLITAIHLLSHVKDKKLMLENTMQHQKASLEKLSAAKQYYRKKLCELKVYGNSLRLEKIELNRKGGILNRPALMLNYDETVAEAHKWTEKIQLIEVQYSNSLKKVAALEENVRI